MKRNNKTKNKWQWKEIRRLKNEKCSEAAKWRIKKIEEKRNANKNELYQSLQSHYTEIRKVEQLGR